MSPNLVSLGFVGPIPAILEVDSTLLLNLPSVKHISLGHGPQMNCPSSSVSFIPHNWNPWLLPNWSPQLTTLAIKLVWLEDGGQVPPPFFLRYHNLATLRLNLDGLPASFWHALLNGAADTEVLPQLEEIELIDCPLHSAQELVLLCMHTAKPISRLSIHMTEYFADQWSASFPMSKTWLIDHTLANTLYPWVPRLAAFFCGLQTDHPVDVWSYIDRRFVDSDDLHHFYREFLGNVPGQEPFCGADEAFFTTLGHQIRVEIYGLEHPHMPRSGTDVSNWIRGVARCILATEAAAFYLNVDSLTAMMLLQERWVRRPMGTHERVLQVYAHAIRDEPEGAGRKLMEEVLVVAPGVAVPFPSAF
ncbi:hypothetical protein K438DRAFT_1983557 [Mycena galopus ATCC 62051]|nr:hypothetical protein K438DRAFT_1983557 [Mycena galopus ATCC 62051]